MKVLGKVKVFDFRNPNIKILNKKEEILEMLNSNNIPIVKSIVTEDGKVIPVKEQVIIGLITLGTATLDGDEIFADMIVNDDSNGEFANYEFDCSIVDDGCIVNNIISVEIK